MQKNIKNLTPTIYFSFRFSLELCKPELIVKEYQNPTIKFVLFS